MHWLVWCSPRYHGNYILLRAWITPKFAWFLNKFPFSARRCNDSLRNWSDSVLYRFDSPVVMIAFTWLYRLSPKNYNRHLGIDCKRTLYGIRKIKPDYETMTISLQFSEDPIWFGQVVTKIYGFFVMQVIGPFLPSFITWMDVASTDRLCSQKTGLQTYSNCMHTFLTKVVPDNIKACQICKIM